MKNSFNNCLVLKHLSCLQFFNEILFFFKKSIISTKTNTASLFAQFAVASIHQIFGGPGRNRFTAARSLQWNVRKRCIIRSLNFHVFIFRGSVNLQPPPLINTTGNSFSNQWGFVWWKLVFQCNFINFHISETMLYILLKLVYFTLARWCFCYVVFNLTWIVASLRLGYRLAIKFRI